MSKISRRQFVKSVAVTSAAGSVGAAAAGQSRGVKSGGVYRSDWSRLPDRCWTDPHTWANPWEDWAIRQGKLVCAHGGKEHRSVHCLTHQLGTAGAAEIGVTISFQGPADGEQAKPAGSAGFELGIRVDDPLDDYRSRLLFGSGSLMTGITTEGALVLGDKSHTQSSELADAVGSGQEIRLVCSLGTDDTGKARVTVSARVAGKEVATATESGIQAASLAGNVALVNNLPESMTGVAPRASFAFSEWTMSGPRVSSEPGQRFGPVLWTLYTLSGGVLKLTAQMPPLGAADEKVVQLEVYKDSGWQPLATAGIDPTSCSAAFRVPGWDDSKDTQFRVGWTQRFTDGEVERHTWEGTIRRDPKEKPEIVAAGFCCFTDYLFPNTHIADAAAGAEPDILFFMGDQLYEGVGGFGIVRAEEIDRMMANYLRKIALVGWSFREIARDRPTVWIPDDHDVYQGNIWGAGGRQITLEEWNRKTDYRGASVLGTLGGYVQPAAFINAVQRIQCGHLPDPYDPEPVEQGITVYYTGFTYGRVSFALLEDRKFKTGPLAAYHHQSYRPDHVLTREAALAADVPGAQLLGDRQLKFLENWTADWRGADMKMAVSQTILCGAATHHGNANGIVLGDMDSNGWPQSGRNAALEVLRRGYALMLAGDQHLSTVIQHGIREHHDAGYSFCVPAGATGYMRWWRPEEMEDFKRSGERHGGRPNTGQYRDGFGNLIDVWAVANGAHKPGAPTRFDTGKNKVSGFGIVRLDKRQGRYTIESWPLGEGVKGGNQYPGWPMTVSLEDCGGAANPSLPPVVIADGQNAERPVVQVRDSKGALVSTARMTGDRFAPRVFDASEEYSVHVFAEDPASPLKVFTGIRAGQSGELRI